MPKGPNWTPTTPLLNVAIAASPALAALNWAALKPQPIPPGRGSIIFVGG
jgi:hypothetical protein